MTSDALVREVKAVVREALVDSVRPMSRDAVVREAKVVMSDGCLGEESHMSSDANVEEGCSMTNGLNAVVPANFLVEAIRLTSAVTPGRSLLPPLHYVVLEPLARVLRVRANGLLGAEVTVKIPLPDAPVGRLALEPSVWKILLKAKGEVTFSYKGKKQTIGWAGGSMEVPTPDVGNAVPCWVDAWPTNEKLEEKDTLFLNAARFGEALRRANVTAPDRLQTSAVRLLRAKGYSDCELIAVDGYRFHLCPIIGQGVNHREWEDIGQVPGNLVDPIAAVLLSANDDFTLHVKEEWARGRLGYDKKPIPDVKLRTCWRIQAQGNFFDYDVIVEGIEGQFPEYSRITPTKFDWMLKIPASSWKTAIEPHKKAATGVELELTQEGNAEDAVRLHFTSTNPDTQTPITSSLQIERECLTEPERGMTGVKSKFNPKYLLALTSKVPKTANVTVAIQGPTMPSRFIVTGEPGAHLLIDAVIMPMHIEK